MSHKKAAGSSPAADFIHIWKILIAVAQQMQDRLEHRNKADIEVQGSNP